MLITIYNNNESDRFETDFKSNLILPKNCELKLTNAYIALTHEVNIPELSIVLMANGSDPIPYTVTIPAGTYTLQAVADLITLKTQTVADANSMDLKINMKYDGSMGYSIGCFTLDVEAQSLLANLFQPLDVSSAGGYNTFTKVIDDILVSAVDIEIHVNTAGGIKTSYLGATGILDKATPPVAVESWGYNIENAELVFEFWLRKGAGSAIQPPVKTDGAGCLTFQDNGNVQNYYVGLSSGKPGFLDLISNDFDQIENLDETPIYALVVKTTDGTFNAGEVYFYENSGASAPHPVVAKISARRHPNLFPITQNDTIGFICNTGGNAVAEYYIKKAASTEWVRVNTYHKVARHVFDKSDDLSLCYSIYGANGGSTWQNTSIKNPSGTLVGGDLEDKLDEYGQSISWDWGTSGTGATESNLLFGFSDQVVTDNATGDDLANVLAENEVDVPVDGYRTDSSWKTAPYINLLCESLPVNSYTDTDTDIGQNGLDNSKCIASIPRYDLNGNFNVGYNLTYNPVEANVIKLNNAEEINVSQLRFRLQQSDGQIPKDLASPMGFVLDFNGQV